MNASKILSEEIADLKVSALPNRPTKQVLYGGKAYSQTEVKEAFDKLPLFIIERYNALLDDIMAYGEESLCAAIETGISTGHTLYDMFLDVSNGNLASYLSVGDKSLATELYEIKEAIRALGGEI